MGARKGGTPHECDVAASTYRYGRVCLLQLPRGYQFIAGPGTRTVGAAEHNEFRSSAQALLESMLMDLDGRFQVSA